MTQACRVCGDALKVVLDMGDLSLSDFPRADLPRALEMLNRTRTPLCLCRCSGCGLVQLSHTTPRDSMFRHYWYQSGINETMREELRDVVNDGVRQLGSLPAGDVVVDVGANDGTLLAAYPKNVVRIAYEPAWNFREGLLRHCNVLYNDYFPGPTRLYRPYCHRVRLLTSIACFYATNDPVEFVRAVDGLLAPDGLWIVQFQDLHQMLQATAFDDVCHEHVFYPCMAFVERLLAPHDLRVVDAQWREINGGSMRLTIGRRDRPSSPRVAEIRAQEAGCESEGALGRFVTRAGEIRAQLQATVVNACAEGKVIDLYGASTKGNTLLQFCGLGPDLIRCAWERSELKWGCRTATGIPIVSEEGGRASPPDILLVLIWQFREAVIRRESDYSAGGGMLLFPLPSVQAITANQVAVGE